MTWQVAVSDQAVADIERIDRWWRKNRRSAPSLFRDELAVAEQQLEVAARSGVRFRRGGVGEVRRLLLPRTRYHVYYRVSESEVLILAVWASMRGRIPKLP